MKMKNLQKMIVGITVIFCTTVTNIQAAEYDHELQDQKITFAWKVEGDTLAVKLTAETEGWVGIGFNPVKEMKGANFILGYVKDGVAKLDDDYGVDENAHKPDTKLEGTSDVTLVGGTEIDGKTTLEFTLPLASADKNDTKIDVKGDTVVLLAYGSGRDSFLAKHKYRTALKVNLTTGASEKL
ncbi:MAG: DOMON domain-containing protein [Proteobacteria bacterium]|nr:DOMON domain-containing protein [Pseudomonadota bacterium]